MSLNVIITTLGSGGDVIPFIAIGRSLNARGHRTTLVTNPHFEATALHAGLEFVPVGTTESYERATQSLDSWHPLRSLLQMSREVILPGLVPVHETIERLAVPNNTVVVANCLAMGARIALETMAVPLITVLTTPLCLRSLRSPPQMPGAGVARWFGSWGTRMAYRIGDYLFDRILAEPVNAFRRGFNLPSVRRLMRDWWLSPDLVLGIWPDWYAAAQPDWPAHVRLMGFVCYDPAPDAASSAEADQFISRGPPPIIFTPGTAMRYAHKFFTSAVEACRLTGRPGMLVTPYTEHIPSELPDGIIHVPSIPFGEFLPRVAAVVHHGGVGTVAQALRAARPQIVCPMGYDQFDNGARVVHLGVGASLPPGQLNGRRMAAALDQLLSSAEVAGRCCEVAAQIEPQEGVRLACEMIERCPAESSDRDAPPPARSGRGVRGSQARCT